MDIKTENGLVSCTFVNGGITTFKDACDWVRALPYRRNSTKNDILIVLKERCGTCSSKHELLKRLTVENDINNCKLILCMFKMTSVNTPKVKSVLDNYGLTYIPEAHTYLEIDGIVNDFTFSGEPELLYLDDVLFTEEINADQIREYKAETHRRYMKEWGVDNEMAFTFEELWGIREECIGALASSFS